MFKDKDEDKAPFWIKAVAQLITAIVLFSCMYSWEFILNPSGNHSVEVRNQVGLVEGISCRGDAINWRFSIRDTWYGYKKSYARIRIWVQTDGGSSKVQDIEVREGQQLSFEACPGEEEDVAYIWSIDSGDTYIHFRVHSDYEITPANKDIPSLEKK